MAADSTGTIGETPGPSTSMENTPPTYDEVFPALPESFPLSSSDNIEMNGDSIASVHPLKPKPIPTVTKLKPSQVTQIYVVSPDERRFKDNNVFRERDQHKICIEIMQETSTRIEMSNSKDGKLTFLISGREDAVALAKKKIAEALQSRGEKSVHIPKEHHKFVLGKNGLKLKDLEERTNTRITVPRQDDSSEAIKIIGTKDGIDRAMHEILSVSHEAASKASEKIQIPKYLHPFIRGAFDETINLIISETGARIAIPPQEVNDDTINIMGDLPSIAAAKAKILKVYDEKKAKCTSVPMQVKKAQHKYIIGRGGQTQREIFKQTGVYVDIPRQDDDTDTVTLWGEPEKIGPALSVLWEKAHSEVEDVIETEPWVHRYILGTKGTNFQEMNANFPNVRVTFENNGVVRMRGPRNDLPTAKKILEEAIAAIRSRISVIKLQIDPKYHRFIIGQKGKQITQIREESKAQVHIPDESDHSASSDVIRIEGSAEAVKKAQEMLTAIIDKQKERENEVTKEISIEQRLHRHFIGSKGEEIRRIRDMFNQVAINFPDPTSKSDKVIIRGSKNDVEKCYKFLAQETQNLLANNYRLEVPISNQFFKLFTLKEKVKIQQMSKDTNTRIDLPNNQSDAKQEIKQSNLPPIIISGKKDDVEKAKEIILKLQKELGNHVQIDIIIPAKFHNSLIGKKGSLIRSISEDCGGVTINFPPENSGSDKVSIIGPKEMVHKAKQQLLELKNEKVENSFEVEIKAKPELHRFLIGKKGTNINKLRTKTGVRIMIPADGDEDQDGTITIVGKKDAVLKAKTELEEMIHDLEQIVEDSVKIPVQFHSHFKRLSAQRQIKEGLGDLQISFPRSNNSDQVSLRGSKDCVEMAKSRIIEMVGDLEAQVTMEVVIPQVYHRIIMGKQGRNVQSIQSEHKVEIQFPKRETGDAKENAVVNGNAEGETAIHEESFDHQNDVSQGKPKESDIIILKGRKENCESAKLALLESIPVTKEVEVPFSLHKFIIGQKGANIRELKEKFDVDISVPPSEMQKDSIQVKGTRSNVEGAIEAINEKVQKLKEEQQERDAKNFKLEIQVDSSYHPKIIGKGGKVVSKIRKQFGVQIQFPEKKDDASDIISIIGYEKNAETARDAILDIVKKLENTVSEEIEIDAKVHRRLIGARGRNINSIMNTFKVEVKFPKENSSNPNLVTISGEPENIERAKDHLLELQDEYLDDVVEQYRPPSKKIVEEDYIPRGESRGFYVKGGPWEQQQQQQQQSMPDTTNAEEFPSMLGSGGGSDASESPKSRGWGSIFNC
ncbi:vigilin [Tetranychus urticae]|uniref:K Homology domain-containing protein n=1 Tax=Tetranychus urticae TaxID=32264 RepID=T1KIC3_TETUR|nr:vigilin [Tetranychus urticae]